MKIKLKVGQIYYWHEKNVLAELYSINKTPIFKLKKYILLSECWGCSIFEDELREDFTYIGDL